MGLVMEVADRLGLRRHDPTRVVYARQGSGPCVVNAWDATSESLLRRIEGAHELVILDPVGFPYEVLGPRHWTVPMTVVLPEDISAQDLADALGNCLFSRLTPHDLVVGPAEVVAGLQDLGVLVRSEVLTPAPGQDGLEALASWWREQHVVVSEASFGRFASHRDDLITRHIQEFGAHQRSDLAMLRSVVREGDVVLDVGAHVGTFAVALARTVGPTGRLVAFEPNPASVELLEENLAANDLPWAEVVHAAVTDRAGQPGLVSLGRVDNTGAATARHTSGTHGRTAFTTTTLDTWWAAAGNPDVAVVKLDVEGLEAAVLRGAAELLDATEPVMLVEVSQTTLDDHGATVDQVLSLLAQRSYRFFVNEMERNIDHDAFSLEPMPEGGQGRTVSDVLCVPAARLDRLSL